MNVVLEASVFTDAPEWCLPIMWFARVGKHRVLPAKTAQSSFSQWRNALSPHQQQAVDHAESWSTQEQASAPSKLKIVVSERPTNDQVSPTTAWMILQRPYRILFEDGFNDRAFLLRMAGSAERTYLRECFEKEWLEADHGGGISSMPRRVMQLSTTTTTAIPLLASCLFDSDSEATGHPSSDSTQLGLVCEEAKMHYYRLARRAIENYLPRSAFNRWISLGGNRTERQARREIVDGYFCLEENERYHAKVKSLVGPVGGLYGDDTAMNDQDVVREGGPAELRPFVQELIERAR
ncbi:MAG: hypothetical protein IPK71_05555 [Myxococcales bacterium]|nr:hypothetical protein [Myxococcales bacterium]